MTLRLFVAVGVVVLWIAGLLIFIRLEGWMKDKRRKKKRRKYQQDEDIELPMPEGCEGTE